MKLFKGIIAILVLSMMVGLGANQAVAATSLFINGENSTSVITSANAEPVYYPNETFKASTYNTFTVKSASAAADPTGGLIQFVPELGITGTDVVFTATNGLFQPPDTGSYYVLYDSTSGTRATTAATSGNSSRATVAASTLTFKGVTTTASHKYCVVSSGAGDTNLNMTTTNGATATDVTLAVAQGGFNTASATFVQFANYWAPTVTTAADATIDVDQTIGRKKFTSSATSDTVVLTFSKASSKGFATKVNSVDYSTTGPVNGGAFASVTIALNVDDITGISSVKFTPAGGSESTLTYDSTNKRYYTTYTTSAYPTDGQTFTFAITVDGTTVLNTRPFTATVSAAGGTGYPSSTTYLTASSAGSWGINGYQAYCPYVNTNTAYGTQFVLNNASSVAADVFWDTISSSSSTVQSSLSTYSNKQVTGKTQIPAYGTVIFNADEVISALGLPSQESGAYLRNQVRVTVTASPSVVTGMAIQADGGTTKRSEPLLIDAANTSYKIN